MTAEPTTLILTGQGYNLTIAPEAEARKRDVISAAAAVTAVTDNDESADAQRHVRNLAALRIEVEKSRKLVKEPVNRIGKLIDQTAKSFVAEIDAEESRIKRLIGDHAAEVARLRAERETEERRLMEEARAAREAAEAAADAAQETRKLKDIAAAMEAERQRLAALDERMKASAEVAGTKIAQGVRLVWDYEVTSMDRLNFCRPEFVKMEDRRADILAWLREFDVNDEGAFESVQRIAQDMGLYVLRKPVVSTR